MSGPRASLECTSPHRRLLRRVVRHCTGSRYPRQHAGPHPPQGSAVRMRMHLLHEAVRTWTCRTTPLRTESRAPHMRPFRPCVCVACHSALQEPLGECSTMECPNDYLMKDSMPVPPPNCHGKTCEACEPVAECTEVPAAYKILSIATSNR